MFSEFPEIEFGSISLTMTALIDLPSQRFETESGHFDFFRLKYFSFKVVGTNFCEQAIG